MKLIVIIAATILLVSLFVAFCNGDLYLFSKDDDEVIYKYK